MDFLLPSPEIKEKVRKELGLDEQSVKEAVEGIKKWLQQQPHLPKVDDDERLERWLIRCKNNMEKTKQTLDLYYSLKTVTPELMTGWDTDDPLLNSVIACCYGILMPEMTSDCDRVCISGFLSTDTVDLVDLLLYKLLFMSYEIRMCEDYYSKEILIFDLKNFTLSHVTKFGLTGIKKLMVFVQRGYNVRIRSIHFVNTPSYADTLLSFIKTCLKKKIADRVHIHRTDFTKLHEIVPKRCLPAELGGNCGTIAQHLDKWTKKFRSYHDWYLEHEKVKSDESKRPNKQVTSSELFGIEGSFRQLNID